MYVRIFTYFDARPVSVQARPPSTSGCPPAHPSRAGRGQPPPQGWTISPRVSEKYESWSRRKDVWYCGLAIYIMDKVEMDEMKGLFCVDILVTLEISH